MLLRKKNELSVERRPRRHRQAKIKHATLSLFLFFSPLFFAFFRLLSRLFSLSLFSRMVSVRWAWYQKRIKHLASFKFLLCINFPSELKEQQQAKAEHIRKKNNKTSHNSSSSSVRHWNRLHHTLSKIYF